MSFRQFVGSSFMMFAFFFGAGNLIFPTYSGMLAGKNIIQAYSGYIIVDVGLSLLAIAAVSIVGRASFLTKDFSKWASVLFWIIIYAIIGPLFAVPRTAMVSFEAGFKPIIGHATFIEQLLFTITFFSMVYKFACSPGKVVTIVGEVMTPVLLMCLFIMFIVMLTDHSITIPEPLYQYKSNPFGEGMLQGYLTMDTLGALAFGAIISSTIKSYGVDAPKQLLKLILYVSLVAAILLSFVYMGLFYMGGISRNIAFNATNGSDVLTAFVKLHFGLTGQVILGLTILIACMTTAIGLITSCADFFHSVYSKISYRSWALILSLISFCIANIGLNKIIFISIPIVFALYPIAIIVVLSALIRCFLKLHKNAVIITCLFTLGFSLLDAIKAVNTSITSIDFIAHIPLINQGLCWLIPSFLVFTTGIITSNIIPHKNTPNL